MKNLLGVSIAVIFSASYCFCGLPRMYSQFLSPFGFGYGVPLMRDSFPFSPRIAEDFFQNRDTFAPSTGFVMGGSLNMEITNTSQLRLNFNRMGIKRAGYTCGVPGTGEVDPFELGAKYALPARKRNKSRRKNARDSNAEFMGRSLSRAKRGFSILSRTNRIAKSDEICWQVKIQVELADGTIRRCSGTIIGSKTILTASHCLIDGTGTRQKPVPPSTVSIQVGYNGHEQCSEIFAADFILPHPSYDRDLEDNDIGLVILEKRIDFARKSCACKLCIKDKEPSVGDLCVVAGDGTTGLTNGQDVESTMKWQKQRVLRQTFDSKCAFAIDESRFTNLDSFLCASDVSGDASCQGDDGSAFVCFDHSSDSHYVAGVVSFSAGCGKDIGSQYAKTRSYLKWIEDNSPLWDVIIQRGWNKEIARTL